MINRQLVVMGLMMAFPFSYQAFAAGNYRGIQISARDGEVLELFERSWALIIGINDYQHVGKLNFALNDARAVKQLLQDKYGFAADHIITQYDSQATKRKILQVLGDELPYKIAKRDRLFVYFAGHGETNLGNGYLIPADYRQGKYRETAISMTELKDILKDIKAKHIYIVLDACYSGMFFSQRALAVSEKHPRYLREITKRKARQALTAGGKEPVNDSGYKNHSVFTGIFLDALETGYADYNGDNIITASEINAYIQPKVAELAEQTPEFGNLPGSEGGEFVFLLPSASHSGRISNPQTEVQREPESALEAEHENIKGKITDQKSVFIETKGNGSDILEKLLSKKLMETGYKVLNSTDKGMLSRAGQHLLIETLIDFSHNSMGIKYYEANATLTLNQSSHKIVSVNKAGTILGLSKIQATRGKKKNQFTKKIAEPMVAEFMKKIEEVKK